MKTLYALSAICFSIILLVSCVKKERTQSTYTFINTTGKRITFDMYASQADYSANANRMQQYVIDSGTNQQITFDALKTFWIDWYSADYSYNNWRSPYGNPNNYTSPAAQIDIAAEDDVYNIQTDFPDTSRSVLLNGNGLSSTWLATITNLTEVNGTHKFIFRKDFQGEYSYTDPDGFVSTQPIKYYIRYITGTVEDRSFGISILNDQFEEICDADCYPTVFAGQHTGRDTMLISFVQFGSFYTFPAARQ